MPQEFSQRSSSAESGQEGMEERTLYGHASARSQDTSLDSVLDDIESTLEDNAEEYVKGFVQKGGE